MKLPSLFAHFLFVLLLCRVLPAAEPAAKPETSPADQAWDTFVALHDDKGAKQTEARIQQVRTLGLDFLVQNPKHKRANSAIAKLVDFWGMIPSKPRPQLRAEWLPGLQTEVEQRLADSSLSKEARAGLVAVKCAIVGQEMRINGSGQIAKHWRAELDKLAAEPAGGLFLREREIDYVDAMKFAYPHYALKHLAKLSESKDKRLAEWARGEAKLTELRINPSAAKLTTLDGREVDFAQLRGKIVYVVFWSTKNQTFLDDLQSLQDAYGTWSRKDFEVVGVCCEPAEERDAVAAFIKKRKIKWPNSLEGKADESEFGQQLAVKPDALPAGFIFNRDGLLWKSNVRPRNVGGELEKLLKK